MTSDTKKEEHKLAWVTDADLNEEERALFDELIEKYGPHNFWAYNLPGVAGKVLKSNLEHTWWPDAFTVSSFKEYYQMKAQGFQLTLYNLESLLPPFSGVYDEWLKKYKSKPLADALLNYFAYESACKIKGEEEKVWMKKLHWHASKQKLEEKYNLSYTFPTPQTYIMCPQVTHRMPEPYPETCKHKGHFFPKILNTCPMREKHFDALEP